MLFGRRKKNPIVLRDKGVVEWKYATCGYCSTGCAIEVGLDSAGNAVTLCTASSTVNHCFSRTNCPNNVR